MITELTLDDLLADPMVLTVMRADRVHPGRVGRELRAVGQRLAAGAGSAPLSQWSGAAGQGEACAW